MLRGSRAPLVAIAFTLALAVGVASPTVAQEAEGGDGTQTTTAPAKAWVLVDAESGAVLAALNHHQPHFVASLAKVMTAFVTLEQLQLSNTIQVSDLAGAQPAMRIGMEPGEEWKLSNALHSLLMVSANDAAYAMAEAAAGDLQKFSRLMQNTADRLGMQDSTWLDPAGFDGEEGFEGGTEASAYDLAIIARNALQVPEIAEIVRKPTYEFEGGDGQPHTLRNHNRLIESFPGATGMKTGYTEAAGHTLIATAERDGRSMIAVVIGAQDHYGTASALLNQGFTTPPDAEGTGEVLPETSFVRAESAAPEPAEAEVPEETSEGGGGIWSALQRPLIVLFLLLAGLVALRRRAVKRQRARRRARRRAYLDAKRRGMIDVIDAERYYGMTGPSPGHVQVMRPEEDVWPPSEVRQG